MSQRHHHRGRRPLLILEGFVALTAIAGGLLLVADLESFPAEWLEGGPFPDYRIPGVILTGVGLAAAGSWLATWRRSSMATTLAVATGIVLAGWLAGEVLLLHQNGAARDPRSPTEALYGAIALALIVVGLLRGRAQSADSVGTR